MYLFLLLPLILLVFKLPSLILFLILTHFFIIQDTNTFMKDLYKIFFYGYTFTV